MVGIKADDHDNLPPPYEEALRASCAELQRAHLRALVSLNTTQIVCIYDTTFVYQQEGREILRELALHIDVAAELSGYVVKDSAQWRWNIAPQGVEYKDYGVTHEVRAESYIKLA